MDNRDNTLRGKKWGGEYNFDRTLLVPTANPFGGRGRVKIKAKISQLQPCNPKGVAESKLSYLVYITTRTHMTESDRGGSNKTSVITIFHNLISCPMQYTVHNI